MVNLAKIGWIALAWLALAGSAPAKEVQVPVLMDQPFVAISVSPKPLYLGTVFGTDKQVEAETNVHVVANCPYQIDASFRGFAQAGARRPVAPEQLSVTINGKPTPVGSGRVTIAQSSTPTPVGGIDVPVRMRVGIGDLVHFPAGQYNGTLVITVMAAP